METIQAFSRSLGTSVLQQWKELLCLFKKLLARTERKRNLGSTYRNDNTVETIILRQRYTKPCLLFSAVTDLQEEQNANQLALAFSACRYLGYSRSPENCNETRQMLAFRLWNGELCAVRAVSVPDPVGTLYVYMQYRTVSLIWSWLRNGSKHSWEISSCIPESWQFSSPIRPAVQQLVLKWAGMTKIFAGFCIFPYFWGAVMFIPEMCV